MSDIAKRHYAAAFINAIAEEGTKAEAIEWLQKQWNENCELRARIEQLEAALEMIAGLRPCPDNLLGNVDIARLALRQTP